MIGKNNLGDYASRLLFHGVEAAGIDVHDYEYINHNNIMFCIPGETTHFVDAGQTMLAFRNETILRERESPIFSLDAHILKEIVWKSVGLPSQRKHKLQQDQQLDDVFLSSLGSIIANEWISTSSSQGPILRLHSPSIHADVQDTNYPERSVPPRPTSSSSSSQFLITYIIRSPPEGLYDILMEEGDEENKKDDSLHHGSDNSSFTSLSQYYYSNSNAESDETITKLNISAIASSNITTDKLLSMLNHLRVTPRAEKQFQSLLKVKCAEFNAMLQIIDFSSSTSSLTFEDQVRLMRNSSLTIAIHGASLVNTMFMPSGGRNK